MSNVSQSCRKLLKEFCLNSSFGGLRFVADRKAHWIERCFWLILVVLSWFGSAILIVAAFDALQESPISFGVDTIYVDWDTKLPTIAICEEANNKKLYKVSDTIWPPGHLLDLEAALREITYFQGKCFNLKEICHDKPNPDPLCPTTNYSYYASLVRSGCEQLIDECFYNGEPFNCCEYFQPLDTNIGTCFAINSIQTNNSKPFPMISNLNKKQGVIKFEVLLQSSVFTLGEDEVPSITTLKSSILKVQPGHMYSRQVLVRNIINDPLVVQTTSQQRACRFHHENQDGLYPHYSYSACTTLCRKDAVMDRCGCYDHFTLGVEESNQCNISGLVCIHRNVDHLNTLKPEWANRAGMYCDCLPSCNETEVTVIQDTAVANKTLKKRSHVEIRLAYLPTERFKRNVVRSRLDLVVSIGGSTGLFLGASILSFVELFFYFTVRFIDNIWMERSRNINNVQFYN